MIPSSPLHRGSDLSGPDTHVGRLQPLPEPLTNEETRGGGLPLFTELPRETVWKIRMPSTLGSQKSVKRGVEAVLLPLCGSKTPDLDPSSYFPNSF